MRCERSVHRPVLMIVADSSVWIALFRQGDGAEVTRLRHAITTGSLLLGDVILLELLQGAGNEQKAEKLRRELTAFPVASMLGPELAVIAAENFRKLRMRGVTVRKTPDLVIATFCIERGHALLHADRDFSPFSEHLGLVVA